MIILEENFSVRELQNLSVEIDRTLSLIAKNPVLFPFSESKGIRKVVIMKFNTMYYREEQNMIEILSFFSNRQGPTKRKI